MTEGLTFHNTRKLLNQRSKTQYGGVNENRLDSNIQRNRVLSEKMSRIALERLDELESRAPATIRKMKDDFFNVSQNMYKLADAIQSVDKTLGNANSSRFLFKFKSKAVQPKNQRKQKDAMKKVKDEFFQVSSRLVSLSESMRQVENLMPVVGKGTNMSNYVRRQ